MTPVSKLSGGEKRRLQLLMVVMKNPNFLILDEPTNDLAFITLNVLEDFLQNFKGCLVMVSHDRYFLDKLADHLLIFEGEGVIHDYNGSYREWRAEQKSKIKTEEFKSKKPEQPKAATKKLSYKEARELELLESEIAKLENEHKDLTEKLSSASGDHKQ